MRKSSINWNVRQLKRMFENKTISFDYPIQRAGNQWDISQKSLLIHSLTEDFPVPALYSKVESEEVDGESKQIYYILDGKQRLTSIIGFVNNEYSLHEDTPSCTIDGESFRLAGKKFKDLNEIVQDEIIAFSLQVYRLDDATDEDVEEVFFRLNNGTSLSQQQKARAKMGIDWARKIQSIVGHPLMSKASFTDLQMKRAENETAVLQTMMIIDRDYDLKNISSNEVFAYSQTFRDDDDKRILINSIVKTMDYLDEALESDSNDVMLKKIHFPATLITAREAMMRGISPKNFYYWTMEFKKELQGRSEIPTRYRDYLGAGSVGKKKTLGRVSEMRHHFMTYFAIDSSDKKMKIV